VRSSDLGAMLETGGQPGEPLWGEHALLGDKPGHAQSIECPLSR
jgi:hypothetical protein